MQNFKGDALELKMIAAGSSILTELSMQKDLFFEGAYESGPLGDVIYNSDRSPLSNAIKATIFRNSFKEIFGAFVVSGSFESYITVFKKIFGDDVLINFTIPGPGRLEIAIEATGVEITQMVARNIENDAYVLHHIMGSGEDEGDNIVLQTIKGFQSQYELEQMLYELVPAGVITVITLTLGE